MKKGWIDSWHRILHLAPLYAQRWLMHRLTPLSMRGTRLAPLALLIDGDNISSAFASHLLLEAQKFGRVTIRRVYGNWALPSMASWQEILFHYGLAPMHLPSTSVKKNAADIALVVDAMELFHAGITHFCLVSSDSDFTPLVRRLREAGCFILGIGKPDTLDALKTSCTVFVSTEQLLPLSARSQLTKPTTVQTPPPPPDAGPASSNGMVSPPTSSHDGHFVTLLTAAYTQAVTAGGNEWVSIQQLGTFLKQLEPGFTSKAYGSTKLSTLIQKYPDLFQTQSLKGGHAAVRRTQEPK